MSRLGKAASKLYREIYRKDPALNARRTARRDPVHKYPCGILEQAYRQLTEQGVPLVKPDSRLARRIERESHRQNEPAPDGTGSGDALRDQSDALRRAIINRMLSK